MHSTYIRSICISKHILYAMLCYVFNLTTNDDDDRLGSYCSGSNVKDEKIRLDVYYCIYMSV